MKQLLILLSLFSLLSCGKNDDLLKKDEIPPPKTIKDGYFIDREHQVFNYIFNGSTIKINYYIPTSGDIKNMPVLFSFHGSDRSAQIQINAWKYFAEAHGFIVIAPEFSSEFFNENAYQFGGVFLNKSFSIVQSKEKWTYQAIEDMFDYFKKETDNTAAKYHMFGHSAGAQFVHRFLLAMPDARVDRAVAANPGSWTFPYLAGIIGTDNKTYGWPYSIANSPFSNENSLKKFFSKKLWIQAGQLDTDTTDPSMPKGPEANAQGEHRLARARFFYEESQRIAENLNTPFEFKLAEVPEGSHSSQRMVYGRIVSNSSDINTPGINSAYSLLFE